MRCFKSKHHVGDNFKSEIDININQAAAAR